MAGFRDRTITLPFPELSEDGDLVYVTIRNPKILPLDMLVTGVATDKDGDPLDAKEARQDGFVRIAKMITAWHVYDPFSDSDPPALLPFPARPEDVAKLPARIQLRIGEEMGKATDPTETPTTPTSSSA